MKKAKSIIAIIFVALLAGLYITTLVLAIFESDAAMPLFKGCVACTIFIPLISYAYIVLHKYAMKRSGRKDMDADASDIKSK